ncbi:hypothetical protein WJX73_006172 [Symbiochloris irregularis]|uniref:Uncharacterized protein n=1 Tax=Symbiochloris irregularis TaxID=706552 RepID=A0AAW1P334_9CHLO
MSRFKDDLDDLSDEESEDEPEAVKPKPIKKAKTGKDPDLAALESLGYKSGPSVLLVPETLAESSWEWGAGEKKEEVQESLAEREHNRAAANSAAEDAARQGHERQRQLAQMREAERAKARDSERAQHADAQQQRRESFQQREKRKRDMGQAKKAKNYVEEEKRQARNLGVYSGFDT